MGGLLCIYLLRLLIVDGWGIIKLSSPKWLTAE